MPEKPSIERIRKHLEFIARPRNPFQNPGTLREVQQYIEGEFQSYGYQIEKHAFEFQDQKFENVIASSHPQTSFFIIAAHFDGVLDSPAADDNASGVACMLETARLLPGSYRSKIKFVAFNLEESGMIGSIEFVKTVLTICGMISLEMVGYTSDKKGSQQLPVYLKPFYPDTGNFLALVGDGNSRKLLKVAENSFRMVGADLVSAQGQPQGLPLPIQTLTVPGKGWLLPETRLSDHSPFWDAGIPALLVTDTSFFRNPHYHTPNDTIDTLNIPFIAAVTEGVLHFASGLNF